ncbi:MAG: hypothetical protein AB7U35_12715 [Sphingobium sp.]
MPPFRNLVLPCFLLLLSLASPAMADEVKPGRYRGAMGPDVAAMLEISRDGRFEYMLSAGALDEHGEGRWTRASSGAVVLDSEPHPKAPVFAVDAIEKGRDALFTLHVVWPDGQDIAAVDFRIGFSDGNEATGYTQYDGWSAELDKGAAPAWIEVSEPFYRTVMPRLDLPPDARTVRIRLTPNDMGTVDFNQVEARMEDGALILHRDIGDLRFVPQGK